MMTDSTRATLRSAASRNCSARLTGIDDVTLSSLQTANRLFLFVGAFAFGAYLQARGILPGILQYSSDVLYLSRQHLALAAISGGLAIAAGLPLGILLTRRRFKRYANMVTQVVNLGTTIPTLALVALAMSIFGI